jgi:hypothetical protein
VNKRKFSVTGQISKNGNLSLYMGELNYFFSLHKGKKVIINFEILPDDLSKALEAYYFNYVVPEFKNAFWNSGERLTDEKVEERLRSFSPIMIEQHYNDVLKCYESRLKEIKKLSNAELIEHIDTLKQIAAEDFGIYIEDPN